MLRKLVAMLSGLIELPLLHAHLNLMRVKRDQLAEEIEMLAEIRDETARQARGTVR